MRLRFWRYDLKLAHRWAISSSVGSGGSGGKEIYEIVFVELGDKQGTVGIGEAAPSSRYNESVDSVVPFMEHINSYQLSFDDIPGSMRCLDLIAPRNFSAQRGHQHRPARRGRAQGRTPRLRLPGPGLHRRQTHDLLQHRY